MPGRLTLVLYNSYDPRRLQEAHRRALARAAPLALAFDLNLAAVGFPFQEAAGDLRTGRGGRTAREEAPELRTPVDVARFVAGSTSVGEGGAYFVELAEKGRFLTFPYPDRGFPPQLGEIVLTTEHAAGPRATTARAVAEALAAGRSQALVFGLGPHGVPRDVHGMAAAELDVTGANYSLETCTALGVVVGAVLAHAAGARA